jgi:hypothetical protein
MKEVKSVPVDTRPSVEHICLSAEGEENATQERVTNLQFDQQSRLHRSETRFTVFNDHYMAVETSGPGKKTLRYEFDLSFLASQPKRVRKIDWLSCALAFMLLFAAITTGLMVNTGITAMTLAVILAGFALSLVLAIYRSRDNIIFVTKHGRLPLLVLLNRNPTPAGLKAFVSDITRRIQNTRKNWSSKSEYLSAELRQHRRLQEVDILSKKEYEVIKQRILGKHL